MNSSCADPPPPKVLLVTPCRWTARTLEVTLGGVGLVTVSVADVSSAATMCTAASIDALLIDERAAADARSRGADTCRRLVDAARSAVVPVMVLARDIVAAPELEVLFDAGAWGVAPYPFGSQSWVSQLSAWVRGSRPLGPTDGLVDPATNLYNDRGLLRRAREVDAAARRGGIGVACAVFSVSTGGAAADRGELARQVADACLNAGRGSDVFARLTSDEFGVIAPGADAAGVRRLVDRIVRAIGGSMVAEPALRVGVCSVPNVRLATISVADMVTLAASRA